MTQQQKRGCDLTHDEQRHVLMVYTYRMTVENLRRRPVLRSKNVGYRMPIITDKEWLQRTFFDVTKHGRLSARAEYCRTTWTREELDAAKAA